MNTPEWTAHRDGTMQAVFIDSANFEHDARLYLVGDFATVEDKLAYAKQIAHALNTTQSGHTNG